MALVGRCYKCDRQIYTLFLIGCCVECHAEMSEEERAGISQKVHERLHSKAFLEKWPTPESFDREHGVA